MKVVLKSELLILVPELPGEEEEIAAWKAGREAHVAVLQANAGAGLTLRVLGPREEICREPINVTSRHPDAVIRLIGNFAATPFELDGEQYACVEAFWQSLRFPKKEQAAIRAMTGPQAKHAAEDQPYGATVTYLGESIPVGTWAHQQLMRRACEAKFAHHDEARSALLSTGERPLVHRMRRDSKTIPGAIMAEIWMTIRRKLQDAESSARQRKEGCAT